MTYLLEVNEGAFRASCVSGDFRLQESGSLRLSTLLPRVERVKQKKWNDMRYPTLKRTLFGTTKCFQFADNGQKVEGERWREQQKETD